LPDLIRKDDDPAEEQPEKPVALLATRIRLH